MGNRIIKESLRTSKDVNSLSDFLFRFWVYLITYVDDYGRGSADPQLLKGLVFTRRDGITEHQITEALQALASKGMILLYEVEGESYFCFPRWEKHQQIRSKKSKFPAPDNTRYHMISDDIKCPRNPIQSNPNTNPNPKEKTRARGDVRQNTQDDGFEAFWNAYPRKTGDIKQAYMEYRRVLQSGVDPAVLLQAATEKAASLSREDWPYQPSAEKWLANKGWLEQQPKPGKSGKKQQYTTAADYEPPNPGISMEELQKRIDQI